MERLAKRIIDLEDDSRTDIRLDLTHNWGVAYQPKGSGARQGQRREPGL
ncbi:MAG: hypothetical protein ABI568_04155 [Pseudarthrobacter sp.]